MRKPYLFAAALTVVIGLTPVVLHAMRPEARDPRVLPADAVDHSDPYSNILPEDYVGPHVCAECHAGHHDRWSRHAHSKMNQLPHAGSVKGDFDGNVLTLPTGTARFSKEGDRYRVTVCRDGATYRRYEVTKTVGTRFMQFYVGRQLEGPEPAGHDIYGEHMLPFSYWFKLKRWLPREYFDPDGDEKLAHGVPQAEALDRPPDVRPFSDVCMNCHNTFAYAYRIYRKDFVGFPSATVAAAIEPLSKALAPHVEVEPTVEAFAKLNRRLDPDKHLVSLGISCESCHFGGREHAIHEKKIRFLPSSPMLQVTPHGPDRVPTADRKNPISVQGICTQCHSGNTRLYPNGAGKGNSREGLDMHRGLCATQIKCVTCHDPHAPGTPSGGPDLPKHLASCTGCHPQYADAGKAAAHARHPAGANVSCLDCHMPRYTQGLDEVVRTHRICVPVEEAMVAAGSANACNLCHLDRSPRWTLQELERGWGKRIEPKREWAAFDRLDAPAGETWLNGKDNHLRLVAVQSYARSPQGKAMLPKLARSLNDPEPLNRVFATMAVQRLLGRPVHECAVDITAAPAERSRQIDQLLAKTRRR